MGIIDRLFQKKRTNPRRIKINQLAELLPSIEDCLGVCSNGIDCLYIVLNNGKFDIEYEAMCLAQLDYIEKLRKFSLLNGYSTLDITYSNAPVDYHHIKYAPVIKIAVQGEPEIVVSIAKCIQTDIFCNDINTLYEVIP